MPPKPANPPPPDLSPANKVNLGAFVAAVVGEYLEGVRQAEAAHPGWRCQGVEITARGALKPMVGDDGSVEVWMDVHPVSGTEVSEIPISLVRNIVVEQIA